MRTTHSAGGVVMNSEGQVLVVSQRGVAWTLPKGHLENQEDQIHAAKREIYEETGIKHLELIKKLGTHKRPKLDSENKDNKEEMKIITIFLFKTEDEILKSHDKDNPVAEWLHVDEVEPMLTHPKDKAFFRKIKDEIKV